jgi:hypothetical protein
MSVDTVQALMIIATVLVAGYSLYIAYRNGQSVTLSGVVESVREAQPIVVQLREIAQVAVDATEQLKRTGEIKTNDEAFNHALNLIKQWVPDEWEVGNQDIISAINASVLVASALAKQAGVSSEHGSPKGN